MARRIAGSDTHVAENVPQQVFAILARRSALVAGHPLLVGWLHRTTRNQAVRVVRREARRKRREGEVLPMMEHDDVDWRRVGPILDELIGRLRESDRALVLLRYFERRSFAEIGDRLGISEDAARMRVDRALARLRSWLEQRHIRSSSAALAAALTANTVLAAPAGFGSSVAGAAVAAASGAMPATLLTGFMATGKLAACAAGTVLFVGTLGFTGAEWQRWRGVEAELERTRQSVRDWSARQAEGAGELAQLERGRAAAARAVESMRQQVDKTAPAAAISPQRSDRDEDVGRAFLERHPEVATALRAFADARTEFTWGAFFTQQQLNADQILAFKELMRERSGFGSGNIRPGRSLQLSPGTGLSSDEVDRRLQELLGEGGHAAFLKFHQSVPAREMVAALASHLALQEHPLTTEQATLLTRMAENHRSLDRAAMMQVTQWSALEAQVQSVLHPQQMEALAAVRAREDFHVAFNRAIRAAAPAPLP